LSHGHILKNAEENFIHGRGYGGVVIFWRKDINHVIKSDDDGNGRINVITVNMKEHPLCIINVYMPSDNSNRDEQFLIMMVKCGFCWISIYKFHAIALHELL
jgi:exonuclease III